ncbi:acyltransferase family protein [Amnibacterium flavum]|uniref:Fucose 4-O-acetylase n=1 Tax=Amnibacterium flavum TaxID=2173173 RepID=A0A2V1HN63_9MICO|nr:acyltransferase family protein [Amnibacterium flavum]PVZ93925.1 fucose 4-O-acetylase [Amnibacterium flavum]
MPPTDAATGKKRRVPLWDNARFAAIVLVVIGHAILRLTPESYPASALYLIIYTFHIPLFVLVSGYFAKTSLDRRGLTRIVTDLALPYLIFETIWTVVQWLVERNDVVNYANPSWTLWFLLALIGWRLLLPLLAVTRYPLAVSVVVSVLAGYLGDIDETFALSRTLGLLPFFVLGWRLRQWRLRDRAVTDYWEQASRRVVVWVRIGAGALFAALIVVASTSVIPLREARVRRFLLFDESYPEIGYDQWWAGGIRLAVIVVAAVFSIAFLALLPRTATWFTPLGAATMYVYLLHTAFLYPLRETGFLAANANTPTLILVLIGSFLLVLLLASKPVRTVFRPLIEPRAAWLLASDPASKRTS